MRTGGQVNIATVRKVGQGEQIRAPVLSRQQQIVALITGIKKNRWALLFSDFFMGLLLLALVLINPSTSMINGIDVIIVGLMLLMFIAASLLLLVLKLVGIYTHFRIVTALGGLCLLMLLASALFGEHGNQMEDGTIPWMSAYVGLMIAYFNASQIRSDATRLVAAFVLVSIVMMAVSVVMHPPQSASAVTAFLWLTGALFMVPVHATVLSIIQLEVQGQSIRELAAGGEYRAAGIKKNMKSSFTDATTGLLNLEGLKQWFAVSRSRPGVGTGALLCLRVSVHRELKEKIGEAGYNRYCHDLVQLLARDLDFVRALARPFEDVFVCWCPDCQPNMMGTKLAKLDAVLSGLANKVGADALAERGVIWLDELADAGTVNEIGQRIQDSLMPVNQGEGKTDERASSVVR